MKVGIHQPETYPYAGYFNKMLNYDLFVLLDDVQFKKNNYQNRNRILSHSNVNWITIPVDLKGHLNSTIRETQISYNIDWRTRNINQLEGAYQKCPYYDTVMPDLRDMILESRNSIQLFNTLFIEYVRKYLGITTPTILSSGLNITSHKNELVLDICKEVGATTYLSGSGGRDYLDLYAFNYNNIEVLFQSMDTSVTYNQKSDEFVPYMSVIDLIMNNSKEESLDYIKKAFTFER